MDQNTGTKNQKSKIKFSYSEPVRLFWLLRVFYEQIDERESSFMC
jgi:hypothetical protein